MAILRGKLCEKHITIGFMGTSVSDTPDLQPRVSFLQLAWKHLNFYIENQKHVGVFFRQLPVHDVDGQTTTIRDDMSCNGTS